jgi:hypothetical protein
MRKCHKMLSALAALSLLAACRDAQIESYRVPKESPPPVSALSGASNDPPATDMAGTAVPTGSETFNWTAPNHWTAKPTGAMRKGSYTITGAEGDADLSITAFPGDTGGLTANINRWRGQISLPPQSTAQLEAELQHLDSGPLHFDIVDIAGTANGVPTRIIGTVLARPGETWFFKLMGPDALVAREKAAFIAFVQTVRSN